MSSEAVKILVVDDELGIREGCRKILAAEGYEVETAPDGLAGLQAFKELGGFSAALVDLKMPRMGGLDLIPELHDIDENIVVLVITAYATIETAVEATKRGAYGYIPKPFTPDELLLPVRRGLERRALTIEAKRLRAERESRLLEVAFERSKSNTIINCMTDAVLVINRDRQIVLRNAAAACILPGCSQVVPPADLDSLECPALSGLITDTLASGARPLVASRELALGKATYMVNASPVVEPQGETLGAVAVLRDITALKRLEVAKSMFVSMVAHEVKSPVAAIEGYLDLVLRGDAGKDPGRAREMLERSLVRARTVREMVSELLNLTAIEVGRFSLKRVPLDLCGVVSEAVELAREKAQAKHLALTLSADEAAHEHVLADRDAMLSVFNNLLDNAIKYTPDGGHVAARVARVGSSVTVSVQDDGVGMSPEETERSFDEFFRAKNLRTSQVSGTGLGLTIVKRLVETHHGRVGVESAVGKGSTFTVALPVVKQEGG